MATHSSVLAWRIPGTGKPGGLPSMGLHRVRHNWSDLAAAAAAKRITIQNLHFLNYLKSKAQSQFGFFSRRYLNLNFFPLNYFSNSSNVPNSTYIQLTYNDYPFSMCLMWSAAAKSLQSCPTLCDPIDGSPPGFPVPGILQARTLEWVAISFSNAWKWKWKWSCSVVSNS